MKTFLSFLSTALIAFSTLLFTRCSSEVPATEPKLDEATLDELIENGNFKRANQLISAAEKVDSLSESDRYLINFEKDKMQRILGDFSLTEPEVLEYVKKYIPNADAAMIEGWVASKVLEAKNIDDEDFKYSDMMMSVEDGLTFLYDAQGEIPKAFRRWIEELKMPETLPSLKNILSLDCRYFSFNYTDFLESEYGVPEKKILHIHGCRRNKEDELVLGHGQNPKKNYNEWYEKTHDQYDSKPIWGYRTNKGNKRVVRFPKYQSLTQSTYFTGEKAYFKGTGYQLAAEIASQMIEAYYENSRKKSEILIENNKRWFEKLGDVTDIVVMGHSLMPVDHPYYREIIKYVPNANWYVSWYSADSLEKLKLFMKEMKLQSDRVQIFRIE